VTLPSTTGEPALPQAVGPLSATILDLLHRGRPALHLRPIDVPVCEADPYALDLQLALYACYELHYRGFAGVDPRWEWNPALLQVRARVEDAFLSAVRHDVGDIGPDATAATEMDALSVEPIDGEGPSYFLRDKGSWEQMREYFVQRSLYHLRRAIRMPGRLPADGTGQRRPSSRRVRRVRRRRGERVHHHLFAELMDAAELDSAYLAYLDDVSADALASVNLMSLFGLHRELRGAAVGHFASTEITSSPGSRRLMEALERMGAPEPCVAFYREHVVADAVHEQVVRTEVVGDLVAREPQLDSDSVFGIRASDVVEDRSPPTSWSAGRRTARRYADRWPDDSLRRRHR
jgi:hypothetical protein